MKITNKLLPEDGEIGIYKMSIVYCQNADCISSRDETQFLTIETRNGGTEPDETFVNIKTESDGWSVDPNEGLDLILKDFMDRFNKGGK